MADLTRRDIVFRYMASEAEYINRLLACHDVTETAALAMLQKAVSEASVHAYPERHPIIIEVKKGKASFSVL